CDCDHTQLSFPSNFSWPVHGVDSPAILPREIGEKGAHVTGTTIGRRAAIAGLAAVPLASRAWAQSDAVKIGVLTDESGPYADSGGAGSVLAARMAVADFGPTVLGKPIEIVH